MNDKVTTLITKWETLVNEQQQRLDNIKDFVSDEFIRNQEVMLDEKRKMINELKQSV